MDNNEYKICKTCNISKKIIFDFPKNGRIYRSNCKICHCNIQKQRYSLNKDEIGIKKKEFYEMNKDIILQTNVEYRKANSEKILLQKREYYIKNRDTILQNVKSKDYKQKRNNYLKQKRKTDKKFCLVNSYRVRLNEVLCKQKKNTYISYLGCTRNQLLDWIEFQLGKTFLWEDYAKTWVLDHVIPINFFNLADHIEQSKCFNWYNLRPLLIKENLEKSNKICLDVIYSHQNVLNEFKKISKWYQTHIEIYEWLRNKLRYGKNPSGLGNPQPSFLPDIIIRGKRFND